MWLIKETDNTVKVTLNENYNSHVIKEPNMKIKGTLNNIQQPRD